MIDLDFIEIGTSDFDTLIEKATDDIRGISIEPMKTYLDRLPNKQNVKKINCAIAFNGKEELVDLYYIPEEVIKATPKISWMMRGCNSIGDYHYQHKRKKMQDKVKIVKIPAIPLPKILEDNNIRGIKFLKIDTEGADCLILMSLIDYLKNKSTEYWPKKIQFESNILTDEKIILETISTYEKLGYRSKRLEGDTILTIVEGN
jgi:FkbM family methyltransferase